LIAELRTKKSCGIAIADFQNLTSATLRSLLPIPLLSGTFSSAQYGSKNQPKIFLELSVSLEPKLVLKGQLHQIFYFRFLFNNPTGFHSQKYVENCGNEALKLRTSEKIVIAELRSCSCGATFL
jgi:hypothetical protein